MRVHRGSVVAVLVSGAVLAGCGATSSSSDFNDPQQKAVAKQIESFASDARSRDYAKVCDDRLTTQLANQLAGLAKAKCKDRLKDSFQDLTSGFTVDVKTVKIAGTTATATVKTDRTSENDSLDTYTLQKQGSDWRISDVGAPTTPSDK